MAVVGKVLFWSPTARVDSEFLGWATKLNDILGETSKERGKAGKNF